LPAEGKQDGGGDQRSGDHDGDGDAHRSYAARIELVGDREATLFLRVTLPLPEGPPEIREAPDDASQVPALERVGALLPECLIELLYPGQNQKLDALSAVLNRVGIDTRRNGVGHEVSLLTLVGTR
jgi:hypothetical protein